MFSRSMFSQSVFSHIRFNDGLVSKLLFSRAWPLKKVTRRNTRSTASSWAIQSSLVRSFRRPILGMACVAVLFSAGGLPSLTVAEESASVLDKIDSVLAPGDHRFSCELGNEARVVEVDYAENNGLPCSVDYEKAGEHQRLWQARNEINFCAQQAQAFIAKLESHGWDCALEMKSPPTMQEPDRGYVAPPSPPKNLVSGG